MATSTFEKVITIDPAAAGRLEAALKGPAAPLPQIDAFLNHSEEVWQCFLNNSEKSPTQLAE